MVNLQESYQLRPYPEVPHITIYDDPPPGRRQGLRRERVWEKFETYLWRERVWEKFETCALTACRGLQSFLRNASKIAGNLMSKLKFNYPSQNLVLFAWSVLVVPILPRYITWKSKALENGSWSKQTIEMLDFLAFGSIALISYVLVSANGDKVAERLDEHTAILAEHTAILAEHTAILKRLEANQNIIMSHLGLIPDQPIPNNVPEQVQHMV